MRYPLRQEDREAREEADQQRLAERAMAPLEARIAHLELALGQIANFNSPDPNLGFMEERDILISIAQNALRA